MDAITNIILNTKEEELENILSPFIKEQFPSFMRSDYGKLILFIKSYYEWCDQNGNASFVTSHLDTAFDIDRNLDQFLQHFENTYIQSLPLALTTNTSGFKPNRKTILKKIRDFYGNKGTESAYKFLFRILYDSDLEVYYPKTDILKVSDGQWTEPRSIKTTSKNGSDLFNCVGGNIVQFRGSAIVSSAFVDSVVQYSFSGLPVTEFFVTDISGAPFEPGKPVRIVKDSFEYTETPYSVLGEFYVDIPGSDYSIGDLATVLDVNGVGFSAKVEQTDLSGGVKKIAILNSGLNYGADVVLQIFSKNTNRRTARVVAQRSAITKYPGYFSGNRGKVSSTKKIPDGNYYQDFSYELKSEVSFSTYFDILKKLIHPSGTRMFGSVLVKKSLQNTAVSASQATFYETPIIGKYTPYTTGTTVDLRNNGVTLSGYWLGATGDLYPLGYNPYIGSTAQVGPNGSTTSLGTIFVGSSLGYTWCYVPEGGRTAHNPIGAPLGGTVSWYLGQETAFNPSQLNGLVLWLKPENIGVCGAVANGASMDVWTDASPKGNHAYPPMWDKWNGALTSTLTSAGSSWNKQVSSNTPVTRIQFGFNGVCGGFTTGRLIMVGLAGNTTGASYTGIDYAVYSYGPYFGAPTASRLIRAYESGSAVSGDFGNAGTNFSAYDNTVFEIEYAEPDIVYRMDGVEKRRVYAGYGNTYYFDSSFYSSSSYPTEIGHSLTVHRMWNKQTTVVPTGIVSTSGIDTVVYAGVTIDKLRPTLVINDGGIVGATGISFNGGVLFGPQTYARATSTSADLYKIGYGYTADGITFGPGSSGEQMLTGRHIRFNTPIDLTEDMDAFFVYRNATDSFSYGLGFVGSGKQLYLSDWSYVNGLVVNVQTWNFADRNPSSYTYTTIEGKKFYPWYAGALNFNPWAQYWGTDNAALRASSDFRSVAYDPHISGASLGMVIGEIQRDVSDRLSCFVNGVEGKNYSPSTDIACASLSTPDAVMRYPAASGLSFSFGEIGGGYIRSTAVSGETFGSSAWITELKTNTPYNFMGVLYEVLVFDRKLQDGERQSVYGYLSRKYKMDAKLPDTYHISHNSAYGVGTTYWVIDHHPNTRNLTTIPSGISFSGITLSNFVSLPYNTYKSEGTVLSNGTVLSGDTYSNIGT
jgi:hypothetical protein